MADKTIRQPNTLEERVVDESAVPFFTNAGWVVLKADGSVNPKPATPTNNADKDK